MATDWYNNIVGVMTNSRTLAPLPYNLNGRAHYSFLKNVSEMMESHVFASAVKEKNRILFTGHSQGAALALLATMLFVEDNSSSSTSTSATTARKVGAVLIAPPKSLDATAVNSAQTLFNAKNVRAVDYVNRDDPIPHLPASLTTWTEWFWAPFWPSGLSVAKQLTYGPAQL
jgi:hypothetical protein